MIYTLFILLFNLSHSYGADQFSDLDVIDWLIKNKKNYHNLTRDDFERYKKQMSRSLVPRRTTPTSFLTNRNEVIEENKYTGRGIILYDTPKKSVFDESELDPSITTSNIEVVDWLTSFNLKTNNLSLEDFKVMRKEISVLKQSGYRITKNPTSSRVRLKVRSGDVCHGDDKININGKMESVFSYTHILRSEWKAFYSTEDTFGSPCPKLMLRKMLEYNYKNLNLISNYCASNDCRIFQSVKESIYPVANNAIQRTSKQNIFCSYQEREKFSEIKDLLSKVQDISECQPLNIGDKKLNRTSANGPRSYLLERTGDEAYKATFNIDFVAGLGASSTPEKMRADVEKCLSETNSYISDGKGRKLEIDITSPTEASSLGAGKVPWVNTIKIHGNSNIHRSHSYGYAGNISCPVIMHELLHLAGLIDEYHENQIGIYIDPITNEEVDVSYEYYSAFSKRSDRARFSKYIPDYNHCRPKASRTSVMNNHSRAYFDAVTRKQGGLLRNAHLEKIISGSCSSGPVKSYNKCASFSRVKARQSCGDRPSYCEDEKVWLDLNES